MKYIAILNGKKYEVEIERVEEYKPLTIEEIKSSVPLITKPIMAEPITVKEKEVVVSSTSKPEPVSKVNEGKENVKSPLPGTVLEIKVNVGDKVKSGQVVVTLEAMKMETEIVAGCDGTVEEILFKKGDAVETDTTLIVLK